MQDNNQEIRLKMKKYLELENVSILAGAGSSFHLGAPIIRTIPDEIKEELQDIIEEHFPTGANPSFEELFNVLQAKRFIGEKKGLDCKKEISQQLVMQKWLYGNCDTEKTKIQDDYLEDKNLSKDRYFYHEMLIKKLLQRPINLRRVNLFTTNYDMAFDYALDKLGVYYINGFMGVHNRVFHPEVYDFDLYYPGQSVSGKVHRAEKVLRYYKLHGSLSWVSDYPSENNTYGIREIAFQESPRIAESKQLMIYPCVSKKSFTLDLPYSELFRHFSRAINQPQSVLICLGYSFNDEHINDIIYQSLSNPSFTLIIVNYNPAGYEGEIQRLHDICDSRIIILEPSNRDISSFVGFVKNILPDLYEEEEHEIISRTMNTLYQNKGISFSEVGDESE